MRLDCTAAWAHRRHLMSEHRPMGMVTLGVELMKRQATFNEDGVIRVDIGKPDKPFPVLFPALFDPSLFIHLILKPRADRQKRNRWMTFAAHFVRINRRRKIISKARC